MIFLTIKLSFIITGFMFFTGNRAFAQSHIEWGETILLNNEPVVTDDKTLASNADKRRAFYGSEYGRMVRLVDSNRLLAAYTVSRNKGYRENQNGGFELEIATSIDNGRHWKPISLISDKGRDLDNAQLIQLSDKSILLACRSVRWQQSYRLPVYRSANNGHSWTKLTTIDANEGEPGQLGKPDKGVYEPHFFLLDDGRLAVMYANEKHVTDSVSYSQIISQKISSGNGNTWGKEIWVAYQPGQNASRPGMPVFTKMKNGSYIVVYEICGPQNCNVYYKISKDGFTWPVGLGTPIAEQTGGPYILSLADGKLVVTSNKGNISISEDYGLSWHTTQRPWFHKKDFTPHWTQTIWSALYQTGPDEVCIITTIQRDEGGHNMQMRFGKINTKPQNNSPTFVNPLLPSGADPFSFYKNGYYYYTHTTGNSIALWKTKNLADLKNAEQKTIFTPPPGTPYSKDIWAPEIHFINDKWYTYFAASNGNNNNHRMYVLENASADPMQGDWIFKAKVADASDKWAIDGDVFIHRKQLYMVWSGWEGDQNGQQNIYIAKMKNPWTIEGKRVQISSPAFDWEKHGDLNDAGNPPHVKVNEGPQFLKNGKKLFIVYSASGCWTDSYALGLLSFTGKNNLLDSTQWKKSLQPVLKQSKENGVYAPGHNSFFKSPDGKEDWILYHANSLPGQGCGKHRSPRAQKFSWNKDGTPNFGEPVKENTAIAIPSEN